MYKILVAIDIMGGASAPDDMPINNKEISLQSILIITAIVIGLILLPKFIKFLIKRNNSIKEENENDE